MQVKELFTENDLLLLHITFFLVHFNSYEVIRSQSLKAEVEWRTQGSRPRPTTQKKSEVKDSPSEDRPSRAQGQECSRPRPRPKDTSATVLQKKIFKKIFRRSPIKHAFQNFFSGDLQNFNNSKKVLPSSRGQGNFRGLEAKDLTVKAKVMDFKICSCGQGRPRGLHLCLKVSKSYQNNQ